MHIAVIGAGNVGGALSAAAVKAGHTVAIAAAHPERAAGAAAASGAQAAASNAAAVEGADLVVLAVPASAVPAVAAEIGPVLGGTPVVDATNPLNATYDGLDIERVSFAHDVQAVLAGAPVVKALNTLFAGRYAAPQENGRPLDAFIAGDDAAAKQKVADFTASLGLRPVDVGGLRMARSLEEMAFVNITLNAGNGWVWQTGWQLAGPTTAG
jgi:8-hydroxy-5-deazaflavin:NADPH oxidoreductase